MQCNNAILHTVDDITFHRFTIVNLNSCSWSLVGMYSEFYSDQNVLENINEWP